MNLSYLKPNFKHHPLNYVFALIFFVLGFVPASAFADTQYYYANGFNPPQYSSLSAFSSANPPYQIIDVSQCVSGSYAYATHGISSESNPTHCIGTARIAICSGATPYFSDVTSSCTSVAPEPDEPENCADLAGQTASVHAGSLTTCIAGCLAQTDSNAGITVVLGGGSASSSLNTFTYTGDTCNTSPNVPWQEQYKDLFDGTDHANPAETVTQQDEEPDQHSCYDTDGKFLGRVSFKVNCPTDRQRCYDNGTGQTTYVITPGQSCPTGSSTKQGADRETLKNWAENTVTNPDGSTTTTKTQTKTETGIDGSKHTTTTTTTGGKNADGSDKAETTTTSKKSTDENENTKDVVSGLTNCGTKPKCQGDVLECAQIQLSWAQYCDGQGAEVGGLDNCQTPPSCTGDKLQCAVIQQNWKRACNDPLTQENLDEALASNAFGSLSANAEVDEDGALTGITEVVDIEASLGLGNVLGDNGRSGSCPSDIPLLLSQATQIFKFDSICAMMTALRPLVIFAAGFLSVMMIYRAVVEQN